MPALRPGWTDQSTSSPLQDIKLCKISCQPSSCSSLPPSQQLTWKAYVSGQSRFRLFLSSLIPSHFCCYSTLLECIQSSLERKGKLSSADSRVVAYEDTGFAVSLNGEVFDRTNYSYNRLRYHRSRPFLPWFQTNIKSNAQPMVKKPQSHKNVQTVAS